MKRKKISKACGQTSRNEEGEAGQVVIQYSGCSITNLPRHIIEAILIRLPIKEIIICRCTCKSWLATISNPEFASLHYAQSEVLPVARSRHVSRILYPLELEQDGRSMDMFSSQQCHDDSEIFQVGMKFDTKLKIPVRNFPSVLRDTTIHDNEEITLNVQDHEYKVVNTCNGFLCLSEPSCNKPVVVCNPVTGEFINLPQINGVGYGDYIDCGFGFSPKTNQYKVVCIFELDSPVKPNTVDRVAQVHILGTGSWKNIGCTGSLKNIESAPYPGYKLSFPTYLNGAVHWFCHRREKLILMLSFDCEKECFLPFSLPPLGDGNRVDVGMGVLEGCLCICDSSNLTSICVWVMKSYGVEKSWTRVFEIDMSSSSILLYGLYQPIKYMSNGALLMFNYPRCFPIYYDPRKPEVKLFEFGSTESQIEIVAHTPSFTSLKDVLAGCNVEVLNVYSRCGGLKLKDEARAISLYEKNLGVHSDYEYEYTFHGQYPPDEYWWGKYEYDFAEIWMKP